MRTVRILFISSMILGLWNSLLGMFVAEMARPSIVIQTESGGKSGKITCVVLAVDAKEKTIAVGIPPGYVFSPVRVSLTFHPSDDWLFYDKVVINNPGSILMSNGSGSGHLLRLTVSEKPGQQKLAWVVIPEQVWKVSITQEGAQ